MRCKVSVALEVSLKPLPEVFPWECVQRESMIFKLFALSITGRMWYDEFGLTVTNSIKQSPSWQANSHSASQEIVFILWNPNSGYRVHKNLPLVPILGQMNPVHNFSPYFPEIHSKIIPPYMPRSSDWSLHFRISTKILYAFLISPCVLNSLSHHSRLNLITVIVCGEVCKSWSSSLCILLQPPAASFHLGPNILLSTLNVFPSLRMKDQVSHPWKRQVKL
jgi:hypothetical protein